MTSDADPQITELLNLVEQLTAKPFNDSDSGNTSDAIIARVKQLSFQLRAEGNSTLVAEQAPETRLGEETFEFQEKLKMLHKINIELSKTTSEKALFYMAIKLGCSELGFDRLGILLMDENNVLTGMGVDSNGDIVEIEPSLGHSDGWTIVNKALEDELHVNYAEGTIFDMDGSIGKGWTAVTPLQYGGQYIGWVSADNLFGQQAIKFYERELLSLFGSSLNNLLVNIRSREALGKREQNSREFQTKLQALQEISIELTKTTTLEEAYYLAIKLGCAKLGFDRIGLFLLTDEEIFGYGIDSTGQVRRLDLSYKPSSDLERVNILRQSNLLAAVREGALSDDVGAVGHGWNALALLRQKDKIIGWINADNLLNHEPLKDYQLELLSQYGAILGHLFANKQAEETLRQREQIAREFQEKLKILHDINLELTKLSLIEDLYLQAIQHGCTRLGFDRMGIMIINDEETIIGFGIDSNHQIRKTEIIPSAQLDDWIRITRALEDDLHVSYLEDAPLYDDSSVVGTGWYAITPLWQGSKYIGYIAVDNLFQQNPLKEYQLELLSLYGSMLSQLLTTKHSENALSQREQTAREFQEKLKTLHDISIELTKTTTLDEAYRQAIILGTTKLGFDRLGLFLLTEDETIVNGYGIDVNGKMRHISSSYEPSTGWDMVQLARQNESRVSVREGSLADDTGVVGYGWNVLALLRRGDRVIGWINADNLFTKKALKDYQLELLSQYGAILGHLFANKRAEESLRISEQTAVIFQEKLKALHDVSIELTQLEKLDELYYQAVYLARHKLGFDRIGLFLFDAETQIVTGTYGIDAQGEVQPISQKYVLPSDDVGWKIVHDALQHEQHVSIQHRTLHDASGIVGHGWVALALLWDGDKAIGWISVDNLFSQESFRDYQLELLSQYGAILGHLYVRKEVEDKLKALNEQLEQRVNERTAELQKANDEIRHFAYIVSHDLRAPLVNLKGFSGELRMALKDVEDICGELIEDLKLNQRDLLMQSLTEDIPEALQFIESSVDSMDTFTRAILKLSRLGRLQLDVTDVNTPSVVKQTLDSLAYQIDQKGVKVIVGDLPIITCDLVSIEQIFGNILSNAVRYLVPERPSKIEIMAEQDQDKTIFRIRDNGRGIAPSDMDKVFAPFRRAGKQDVPGEGMGLAYVQTLVRRHGGHISCESEVNVGTTFTFTIPNDLTADISNV